MFYAVVGDCKQGHFPSDCHDNFAAEQSCLTWQPSETLFCQLFCDTTDNTVEFFLLRDSCQLLRDFLLCCFFWRYCLYEMTEQFCYILKAYIYIQRSSKLSTARTEDFGNAVLVEPGRVANGKLERLRFKDCIWWANGDIRNGDAVYYIFVECFYDKTLGHCTQLC